ncbi:MAG: hypothetical protein AAGA68_16745 [Pseudomonadota bacterium]
MSTDTTRKLCIAAAVRRALGTSAVVSMLAGLSLSGTAAAPGPRADADANAAFPPVIELASLLPFTGGDGSAGFVVSGSSLDTDGFLSAVPAHSDFNGDGIDDLILPSGRDKFVLFGDSSGFPPFLSVDALRPAAGGDGSRGFVIIDPSEGGNQRSVIASAGDVNADGIDDVIIGNRRGEDGDIAPGVAYVLYGRSDGFPAEIDLASLSAEGGGDGSTGFELVGVEDLASTGTAVSGVGDMNGDGIDDFVVGASDESVEGSSRGVAYVVYGRAEGFPIRFELGTLRADNGGDGSEGLVIEGTNDLDRAGSRVGPAGDINGDGLQDLIIDITGFLSPGPTAVVFGRRNLPARLPLRSLNGANGFTVREGNLIDGVTVVKGGDINGDSLDDLIVGEPFAYVGNLRRGSAYVLFGKVEPFEPAFSITFLTGERGGDGSEGYRLAGNGYNELAGSGIGAADVNGDGLQDVIVGIPRVDVRDNVDAGRVYVLYGRTERTGPDIPLFRLLPVQGGDGSEGFSASGIAEDDETVGVGGVGDINGDGIEDFAFAATEANRFGREDVGQVYVLFGRLPTP